MDNIQKFYSDVEKLKKHYRANNSSYNGEAVCRQVQDLFAKNTRGMGSLGDSFSEYWLNTYILNSPNINEEPTAESTEKLCAMLSLLENSDDPKDTEALTKQDWKELCSLVNLEAEDLPIDLLNDLMIKFVDKQAL